MAAILSVREFCLVSSASVLVKDLEAGLVVGSETVSLPPYPPPLSPASSILWCEFCGYMVLVCTCVCVSAVIGGFMYQLINHLPLDTITDLIQGR